MNTGPTRILVVDDSALYRQSIDNVLRDLADAHVVGRARDGVEALQKIEALDPDLLTLDVQMPDMDGIQLLREMRQRRMRAKAVMVSSFTSRGAQVTTEALMEGAFDFILKPSNPDWGVNRQQLKESLEEKIAAFREAARDRGAKPRRSRRDESEIDNVPTPSQACELVVIGASTGGPSALKSILPKLPADLPVPILVVQHMPPKYTASLAARLNDISEIAVVEAHEGIRATPGCVYVAPGGQHMGLSRERDGLLARIKDDPPVHGTRPSVDYLIHAACDVVQGSLLAVILTGMGSDGVEGCRQLKQLGGYAFAQHQCDSVVYGMPKAVIQEGLADRVLPLGKIAPAIVRHVKRSRRS